MQTVMYVKHVKRTFLGQTASTDWCTIYWRWSPDFGCTWISETKSRKLHPQAMGYAMPKRSLMNFGTLGDIVYFIKCASFDLDQFKGFLDVDHLTFTWPVILPLHHNLLFWGTSFNGGVEFWPDVYVQTTAIRLERLKAMSICWSVCLWPL
jgi:hypothetical protein